VHVVLNLASILLIVDGSSLLLYVLRDIQGWSQRRRVQLSVLAMPSVLLGLGVGGLHHFLGSLCLMGYPLWDVLLGPMIPLGMGAIALGAICLGFLRLLFMRRVVTHNTIFVRSDIQALADVLAQRVHAIPPRVFLCLRNQPLAFTYGIFRPTIILSTWMVEHLDLRELEAVLAHELEHVARRDYLMVWLSMILRDAFFYLPSCQTAYQQLQREKELACDDMAVRVTQRPLALASALAKVWQNIVAEPPFAVSSVAQSLIKREEPLHGRIARLLSSSSSKVQTTSSQKNTLGTKVVVLSILLSIFSIHVVIVLVLMKCYPLTLF